MCFNYNDQTVSSKTCLPAGGLVLNRHQVGSGLLLFKTWLKLLVLYSTFCVMETSLCSLQIPSQIQTDTCRHNAYMYLHAYIGHKYITYIHVCININMHTDIKYRHTQTGVYLQTDTHTYSQARMHTQAYIYIQTGIHIHTGFFYTYIHTT